MPTIIAGTRTYNNYKQFKSLLPPPTDFDCIISGGAAGADSLGERFAKEHNIPLMIFPADWKTHGKAAGPIRNTYMLKSANRVIAFWDLKSRGTLDLIQKASKKGIPYYIHKI